MPGIGYVYVKSIKYGAPAQNQKRKFIKGGKVTKVVGNGPSYCVTSFLFLIKQLWLKNLEFDQFSNMVEKFMFFGPNSLFCKISSK